MGCANQKAHHKAGAGSRRRPEATSLLCAATEVPCTGGPRAGLTRARRSLPPVAACERIGHWQGAEQHFQEFQRRGIQPNTVAFNRLISALGRGGQWEQALAAFQAMQQPPAEQQPHRQQPGGSRRDAGSSSGQARNSGGESSSSSSPSHPVPSLQAAAAPVVEPTSRPAGAAAPAPAGQRQRARRRGSRGGGSRSGSDSDAPEPVVYTPTPTARPDRITYGSLIAALERGGQWERALAVFEDMQAQGIQARLRARAA